MKRSIRSSLAKRRTTLTLPADSLRRAERIARTRHVNLSTVVAEALEDGLRMRAAAERSEAVMRAYRKAFSGFSEEQLMTLDGIILRPVEGRTRARHSSINSSQASVTG